MTDQKHSGTGDNVGRDKTVTNIEVRLSLGMKFAFITLAFCALVVAIVYGFYKTTPERSLAKEVVYNIEELTKSFRVLAKDSLGFDAKGEIVHSILNGFNTKTKVILKGEDGTIVNEYELEHFLKELSFGSHPNLSIEKLGNSSITVRYKKTDNQ